jgi:hypothetical protein
MGIGGANRWSGGRWRATRTTLLGVAIASLALTGCSQLLPQRGVRLFCVPPRDSVESGVVLMAQADRSARFVPCVEAYPAGWTLASFDARSGEVVMTFDSDRAGLAALKVTFAGTCHAEGSTKLSDEVGVTTVREKVLGLKPNYKVNRYYMFRGGCMMFALNFRNGTNPTLTTDPSVMVHLIERATIEAQVEKLGFTL